MKLPSKPSILRGIAIAGICTVALWAGSRFLYRARPNAVPDGAPGLGALQQSTAGSSLEVPDNVSDRSSPASQPLSLTTDAVPADVAGAQHDGQADEEAWKIVAQLEDLARAPKTFHAAALPLVELLTTVCAGVDARTTVEARPSGRTLTQELLIDAVLLPRGSVLVRGAVFLALAPLLSESEFWRAFSTWFSGDSSVPLELLRTGALAAARIGSPSPCKYSVAMKQLAALPLQGNRDLPGFYPIARDRVAPDTACEVSRRGLDSADPRKELFRLSTTAPPADLDLAAAGDYFVTVEVLYCVWGGQCLVKPAIAQAVLQEALLEGPNLQDRNLVCVRAANFLVASLAMCTDTFFEAAGRIGMSTNPIVSSLAHDLDGLVSEGLGIATMARIESLRYSADPQEKVDLILTLTTVGNNLARMER
jgi:hypothetical protein